MSRRRVFTIEDTPLVGGALALDFVNTTGARASGKPRERLHSYADLIVWAQRVGIIDPDLAKMFAVEASARPHAAAKAFLCAVELRDIVYAVLAPLAKNRAPPANALEGFERWFSRACRTRRLEFNHGRLQWNWTLDPTRFEVILLPIVASAEDLVLHHVPMLKKCGECDWLFLDTSKNQSRQWCKTLCADRVRSRRHYHRRRES